MDNTNFNLKLVMKNLTKMTYKLLLLPITAALVMSACKSNQTDYNSTEVMVKQDTIIEKSAEEFEYVTEQFADLRILRYEIPGSRLLARF